MTVFASWVLRPFLATLSYLHMACLHDIDSMSVPCHMFNLDVLVVNLSVLRLTSLKVFFCSI